jgi:hypothetical protein
VFNEHLSRPSGLFPTKGGRLRQSESAAQKGACIDSDFRERSRLQHQRTFPALPDTGPPSTAGFVFLDGLFSTAGAVPANLPVGRDLTIRRKIENGRYYCAFCRLKAHHRIRAPRRA